MKPFSTLYRFVPIIAIALGVLGLLFFFILKQTNQIVLIEAEKFDNYGGWIPDSQFMDQMGSPYLMAHGLGEPVADATTSLIISKPGEYWVFVRTINWAAPLDAAGEPGKFMISIDGSPLRETFGTKGNEWSWHHGGTIELGSGIHEIRLIDLTGFNGRCDAIILANDPAFIPPNQPGLLAELRRRLSGISEKPEDKGTYDLVVVGGGMAGSSAAISAARSGLSVALIQDRPVLGGNNSSEIRVPMRGGLHWPPYRALGGVVYELGPENFSSDTHKEDLVRAEPNIDLVLNTRVTNVEKTGNLISAVIGQDVRSGQQYRFKGKLFSDCTGDGNLGYLAGADFRYGRESYSETGESDAPPKPDNLVMGATLKWQSVDLYKLVTFPETPWGLFFNNENYQKATSGDWDWEAGFRWHQVEEAERIRDHLLRAIFSNWSFQKNYSDDKHLYAHLKLDKVSYVLGKRESRRILGDVILQEQDIVENRHFPDAAVTTTWSVDVHYPHPDNSKHFPNLEFKGKAQFFHDIEPYPIPYRCLYSRNIGNLFMAGRNISVTHVALGTVRVMYTGGSMGEAVGMAAALCRDKNILPRQVYTDYLEDFKVLLKLGTGRNSIPPEPPWEDVNFLPGHLMRKYRQARRELGSEALGLSVHGTISKHDSVLQGH